MFWFDCAEVLVWFTFGPEIAQIHIVTVSNSFAASFKIKPFLSVIHFQKVIYSIIFA